MIQEHDSIVLTQDLPDEGLQSGDVGTVVHLHREGAAYEVEFISGRKRPKLVTVEPGDIEPAKPNS